jgi:hypothetical protein
MERRDRNEGNDEVIPLVAPSLPHQQAAHTPALDANRGAPATPTPTHPKATPVDESQALLISCRCLPFSQMQQQPNVSELRAASEEAVAAAQAGLGPLFASHLQTQLQSCEPVCVCVETTNEHQGWW